MRLGREGVQYKLDLIKEIIAELEEELKKQEKNNTINYTYCVFLLGELLDVEKQLKDLLLKTLNANNSRY